MKWIGRFSLFVISALLIWGVIYGYNQITDGFSVRQMSASLPYNPQFAPSILSSERKEEISQIFDQSFSYLGKGCQFYAFESEDGKYVVKFLKQKHLRPHIWLRSIPMPDQLRAISEDKITRRLERAWRLFSSCRLAFEELPEETGLLYVHLTPARVFEKRIIIEDKVGCKHSIAIDDYEFLLQKKAIPVKEVFSQLIAEGKEDQVAVKVAQLASLVLSRCEKGICDGDRSFVQNVGFCQGEERAVFIDCGQFFKDSSILSQEEQEKELSKRFGNLHYWTEKNFPQLLSWIE